VAACLFALAATTGLAQKMAPPAFKPPVKTPARRVQSPASSLPSPVIVPINRMVILLDPAHGGMDSGARISDATLEKDVTLALGFKLRSLLSARGFAVVMTRDADNPVEPGSAGQALTLDDRAGIANHTRASACLLLHATGSGNGVHLYRSELEPIGGEPFVDPWLTAQAAWVAQSERLEDSFATAFSRAGVPLVTSSASVRPVDSLTCPALVIELAPQGDDPDSINDVDYQQRVAQTIVGALLFWPNQVQPVARIGSPSASARVAATPDTTEEQP
jgi:N-acetylmuramoyl-L-alanine amidase